MSLWSRLWSVLCPGALVRYVVCVVDSPPSGTVINDCEGTTNDIEEETLKKP